ncbi:MAG: sulfite exporter TauE/SafE family protein [Candidatus Limnocylindrales bacterium]
MNPLEAAAIVGAGVAAGTINTIVGSGSLITFPTLLLFGYSPLVANVSNTVGLVPGSVSGVIGYRRELAGQRGRAVPLALAALGGGLSGAVLLLVLPQSAFERIVPILILVACALMAVQPRLADVVAARRAAAIERSEGGPGTSRRSGEGGPALVVGVYLTAVYGGYFGAAQGVILMALLAILIADDLQHLNALKNVLAAVVNGVAAVVFIAVAPVAWAPAVLLAVGSIAGGQLGARIGRRLPSTVLRAVIVVVGLTVAIRLLIG